MELVDRLKNSFDRHIKKLEVYSAVPKYDRVVGGSVSPFSLGTYYMVLPNKIGKEYLSREQALFVFNKDGKRLDSKNYYVISFIKPVPKIFDKSIIFQANRKARETETLLNKL